MEQYYTLEVAGVTRQLPIMQVSDSLCIASFVILGDCEIVTQAAPLIEAELPQVDYIVTAEAKGIPLVHELCRLRGLPYYIVARKSVKVQTVWLPQWTAAIPPSLRLQKSSFSTDLMFVPAIGKNLAIKINREMSIPQSPERDDAGLHLYDNVVVA